MIYDEPEAGIDLWSFARLTETFNELHQKHDAAMIIISHQERIISLADEIIVIAGGAIRHRGTKDAILPLILADTLGKLCPRKGVHHQMSELNKEISTIDEVDAELLEKIADMLGKPVGAFNIRKNGGCAARESTEHIKIDPRTDGHEGHRHPHPARHQGRDLPHPPWS